jgi:hypothetical protein
MLDDLAGKDLWLAVKRVWLQYLLTRTWGTGIASPCLAMSRSGATTPWIVPQALRPSTAAGHANRPSSNRFVGRRSPLPSQNRT